MKTNYLFFLGICLLMSSCQFSIPDEVKDTLPSEVSSMRDLDVPDGYNFSTTFEQEITLVAIRNGAPLARVEFFFYTAPPSMGGDLIDKGLTDQNGEYKARLTVAKGKEAIYAYTSYGDFVKAQRLEVNGTAIRHEWGTLPLPAESATYRIAALDSTLECDPSYYQVIGNALKKLDVLTGTYTSFGTASSNYNGIGYNEEDGLIYGFQGSNLWRIKRDGTETNLGSVSGNGAVSYVGDFDTTGNWYGVNNSSPWKMYKVDVDQRPLTAEVINLTVTSGSPSAIHDMAYNALFDKFYGLVSSNCQLVEFDHKAGTARVLAQYGSTTGNGAFGAVWCEAGGDIFFSRNSDGKVYHIEMDETTGLPATFSFLLDGESTSNNDGASCALAPSPFVDFDGDGVPNGNDDDWQDSTVTTIGYIPGANSFGTLAFEDFWPREGDYDFNDLVIDYQYLLRKNASNNITALDITLNLQAVGAGAQIGFGISFDDLLPTQVSSVTGTDAPSITTGANGCESGQTQAVIVALDNAHKKMGQATGKFINVSESSVSIDQATMSIRVTFTSPIATLGTINPFIIVNNDRGREIHMKGYAPTDLVNNALFNTEADASNGSNTYQTATGLPWAIDVTGSEHVFIWPTEKTDMIEAYPKLKDNVESNGANFSDWYSSSNRVSAKIHRRRQ